MPQATNDEKPACLYNVSFPNQVQGRMRSVPIFMFMAAAAAWAQAPAPPKELAVRWAHADRVSGVYYANEKATIGVIIDNAGEFPLKLDGTIDFGPRVDKGPFKPTASLAITASELAPGKRARLDVPVVFGEPGPYELRINGTVIESAAGVELKCIYAPRGTADGKPLPFVTTLPPAAGRVDGFLADYALRTGITIFAFDEQFELDASGRSVRAIGTATGLSAEKLDTLIAEMKKARLGAIVRLKLPAMAKMDAAHAAGIATTIENAATRWGDVLRGIVLEATEKSDALLPEMIIQYRGAYASAGVALKKQNAKTVLLGAGSAEKTLLLLGDSIKAQPDAVVIAPALDDLLVARSWKKPLYVLPSDDKQQLNPAVLLGAEARLVPVDVITDCGATAHLFGGSVFADQLNRDRPPYIAVFQNDGFTVAAIAGLGAGTPFDAAYTQDEDKPAARDPRPGHLRDVAALEVADDNRIMRVVDSAGREVNARVGDILYVPLGNRIVYLLMTGTADELTALLRTAKIHGLNVKKK